MSKCVKWILTRKDRLARHGKPTFWAAADITYELLGIFSVFNIDFILNLYIYNSLNYLVRLLSKVKTGSISFIEEVVDIFFVSRHRILFSSFRLNWIVFSSDWINDRAINISHTHFNMTFSITAKMFRCVLLYRSYNKQVCLCNLVWKRILQKGQN